MSTLPILAKLQELIRSNKEIFDNPETISVRPAPVLVEGEPDWSQAFIEVKARDPERVAPQVPEQLQGIPVQVIAATIPEQILHLLAIRGASPEEQAQNWRTGLLKPPVEARNYSRQTYKPQVPSRLAGVEATMNVKLCVSPESGWRALEEFLQPAREWIIAIYDFTAPHIIQAVKSAVEQPEGTLKLVLDRKVALPTAKEIAKNPDLPKAKDWLETRLVEDYAASLNDRFSFTWASTGSTSEFASAYHIKVAVRDGKAFWLSSGNWQSSNQPDLPALIEAGESGELTSEAARQHSQYNREWHAIVEDDTLAAIFRDYIQRDYRRAEGSAGPDETGEVEEGLGASLLARPGTQLRTLDDLPEAALELELRMPLDPDDASTEAARQPTLVFPPGIFHSKTRKVQPILTPDNYAECVLPIIQSAKQRLWFQNQSLSVIDNPSAVYEELLQALKKKSWRVDDCKIIFRDIFRAQTKDYWRRLEDFGMNMKKVKVMGNCHTKGLLVDSRWTLLGSHNWTNEGTTYNRDASLLFDDPEITAYFEPIFHHDWNTLAQTIIVNRESLPVVAFPGEPVSPGTVIVPVDPRLDPSTA